MADKKLPIILGANIVTKEDFEKAFAEVVKLVMEMKKNYKELLDKLEDTYKKLLDRFEKEHEQEMNEMKQNFGKEYAKMYPEHKEMMKKIDMRLSELENGKDGIQGEQGIAGKDGSPDTPEQVREKLESLKGEQRLNVDAIDGLEEKIKELKTMVVNAASANRKLSGMGMKKVPIVQSVDLTSQVNGSATTFTLPRDTVRVLGVWSTSFPITFRSGTDFTLSGNTLTLTSEVATLQQGQTLHALVETLFYA